MPENARTFAQDLAPAFLEETNTLFMRRLFWKRVLDVVGSALLLVLLAPIFVLIAVAQCAHMHFLDDIGSILYVSKRFGRNKEIIKIHKFRTMFANQSGNGPEVTCKDDIRVTPLGKFLRRSSLDELPQLWDVLVGRMSLVGPRPAPLTATAGGTRYKQIAGTSRWDIRHSIRPGITGWAQINVYRGETATQSNFEQRLRFDLTYITYLQETNLFVDIRILLITPISCVRSFWTATDAY